MNSTTSLSPKLFATAVLGVAMWVLGMFHIQVPDDVVADFSIIVISAAHYLETRQASSGPKASPDSSTSKG